jgi:hypothetical protein
MIYSSLKQFTLFIFTNAMSVCGSASAHLFLYKYLINPFLFHHQVLLKFFRFVDFVIVYHFLTLDIMLQDQFDEAKV